MKVLFVDVDGPLIPGRAFDYAHEGNRPLILIRFDPCAVAFLKDLIEKTGLKLVVSSSWREHPDCLTIFMWNNLPVWVFHNDWRTDVDDGKTSRTEKILKWVAQHPDVTCWAALDDEILYIPTQNFVLVTAQDGLLREHQSRLESIFGVPQ